MLEVTGTGVAGAWSSSRVISEVRGVALLGAERTPS